MYGKHNGKKSRYNQEKYSPLLNVDFLLSSMCCDINKKSPLKKFEKKTGKVGMTGQTAAESDLREESWLKHGCNAFDAKHPISNPCGFWVEQDFLQYVTEYGLAIAPPYGKVVYENGGLQYESALCGGGKLCTTGCDRTGCIYCGFGLHLEKGTTRFQRLKQTHPRQYEYCLEGGAYDADGLWKPANGGLGMRHVFEELNKIYGKNFIRY